MKTPSWMPISHQTGQPGLPSPDEHESRTYSVPSIAADDALPQLQILIR